MKKISAKGKAKSSPASRKRKKIAGPKKSRARKPAAGVAKVKARRRARR